MKDSVDLDIALIAKFKNRTKGHSHTKQKDILYEIGKN